MMSERAWAVWCYLVGHTPQPKFSCTICRRCRVVLR